MPPMREFGLKVQINIRGRTYTVRTDEEEIDLQQIAGYVDRRMAEIAERTDTFDEYTIALLAALNIAEDFARFRLEVDAELGGIDRDIAASQVLLESALPAAEE